MSWKASGYVKELRDGLTVTEKFVLLILAEYHRTDEKMAWPSVATLAADCLMTERGVQQILARLVEKNFIIRSQSGGGRGHISGYRIVGVDGVKDEPETPNVHAGNKKTLHSHSVKGERNPAQPAYRYKEEPVLELVEQETLPPSSGNGKSKHATFQELIFRCYRYLNDEDPPWDASDAKQLSAIMKALPSLDAPKFHVWLGHYAASQNINPPDRPRKFLPNISSYANGPLDRYGKPIEESA